MRKTYGKEGVKREEKIESMRTDMQGQGRRTTPQYSIAHYTTYTPTPATKHTHLLRNTLPPTHTYTHTHPPTYTHTHTDTP